MDWVLALLWAAAVLSAIEAFGWPPRKIKVGWLGVALIAAALALSR
jgi:hypothetical protein